MVSTAMARNIYPVKDLRTLAGKANHIAGVLFTWRPFLQELWSALYNKNQESRAPFNCVWTKQIMHTLSWISAFLAGSEGTIRRTYTLDAYLGRGTRTTVKLDASPWGLGGILLLDGAPTAWFASELTHHDFEIFGHESGSSSGQQTWECLAVLVALRLWSEEWRRERVVLEVRGDSVAALTMAMCMKAGGSGPGMVSRELALLIGEATFRPTVFSHIPGIANVSADGLSRRFEPGKKFAVPACLLRVPEWTAPERPPAWYRSLNLGPCRPAGAGETKGGPAGLAEKGGRKARSSSRSSPLHSGAARHSLSFALAYLTGLSVLQ